MRILIALVGAVASLGLLAVSMAVNVQFGLSLGRDAVNAAIFGAASLCCDGLKAALPFAVAWSFRERRYVAGATGALLFCVATAYSLTSALGFAAINRSASSGSAQTEIRLYADLTEEAGRLRSERRRLGDPRPIATIDAAIRGAQQSRRWSATAACTDATVRASIRFCERYFSLKAERGQADRAGVIDARLATIRTELAQLGPSAAARQADPQVAALTQLLPLSGEAVRLGLLLLVTGFVELGSGFGFYVSLSHLRRSQPPPGVPSETSALDPPTPIAQDDAAWAAARLVLQAGASAPMTDLYADYQAWLGPKGRRDRLAPSALAAWLVAEGHRIARIDGRERVIGVRLKSVDDVITPFRNRSALEINNSSN